MVILQASRLERWKGQAVHLEALGLLRDIPGWECWLAGGPKQAGETVPGRIAVDCGAGRNRGPGAFPGPARGSPSLMAAADVFCQPNAGPEPFGIVLVEALYAGLPVVTSGFGGAAEIVDQTCGVLTAAWGCSIRRGCAPELDRGPVKATGVGGGRPKPGTVALRTGPSAQRCRMRSCERLRLKRDRRCRLLKI